MLRGGLSEVGASEGAVGTLWTRVEVDLGESDAFVWLWSAPLAGGALWASVGGSASRPAATCSGPIAGLTWSVDFGWLGRRAFLERLAMSPSPRSSLGLQGIQVCECEMASARWSHDRSQPSTLPSCPGRALLRYYKSRTTFYDLRRPPDYAGIFRNFHDTPLVVVSLKPLQCPHPEGVARRSQLTLPS